MKFILVVKLISVNLTLRQEAMFPEQSEVESGKTGYSKVVYELEPA